ncbi:hypothetical protein [Sulfolobus spindle-shaped virus]|nr:hypothetical protein [Sulfolobus spindle-shaped virus]
MVEVQNKEILQDELQFNFFIQSVRVEDKTSYNKLYVKINAQEGETQLENKINYEETDPEFERVKNLLIKIYKLYEIYRTSSNEKVIEGVREEILKKIAKLLWNIYH